MSKKEKFFSEGGPINSPTGSRFFSGEFSGGPISFEKQIEEESNKDIAKENKGESELVEQETTTDELIEIKEYLELEEQKEMQKEEK